MLVKAGGQRNAVGAGWLVHQPAPAAVQVGIGKEQARELVAGRHVEAHAAGAAGAFHHALVAHVHQLVLQMQRPEGRIYHQRGPGLECAAHLVANGAGQRVGRGVGNHGPGIVGVKPEARAHEQLHGRTHVVIQVQLGAHPGLARPARKPSRPPPGLRGTGSGSNRRAGRR